MYFSIIIPVFNRPQEINDLLKSLTLQEFKDFEVIIVEDGSQVSSEKVVNYHSSLLNIRYFYINNIGQGFARNFGMGKAQGLYFVLFDSDCIIPAEYLSILKLRIINRQLDAHGGPDAADDDFSLFQKAINYSMTSLLTTGGIRGKMKNPAKYQARGFNMGMTKDAFLTSGGFIDPNQGEDIELSIRLKKLGYNLELVEEAFVYHKRKNTWWGFFKQSFSFGRNRINVSRFHPDAVKPVHLLPAAFLIYCILLFLSGVAGIAYFEFGLFLLLAWVFAIFIHSSWKNKSVHVGILSVFIAFGQLNFYGAGLIYEFFRKIFKK